MTRIKSSTKENSSALNVKGKESWQLRNKWDLQTNQWLLFLFVQLVATDGKIKKFSKNNFLFFIFLDLSILEKIYLYINLQINIDLVFLKIKKKSLKPTYINI